MQDWRRQLVKDSTEAATLATRLSGYGMNEALVKDLQETSNNMTVTYQKLTEIRSLPEAHMKCP